MSIRWLASTGILLLLLVCSDTYGQQLAGSELRQTLKAIFGNNNDGGSGRVLLPCVKKWTGNIRLSLSPGFSASQIDIIQRALSHIEQITGLSMQPDHQNSSSNFHLKLSASQLPKNGKFKSLCMAQRNENHQCEIIRAFIQIPAGLNDNQFAYCVYHELLHGIGIQGHVKNHDSIMDPDQQRKSLSDWDIKLIEALYQTELPVGSSIYRTTGSIEASY